MLLGIGLFLAKPSPIEGAEPKPVQTSERSDRMQTDSRGSDAPFRTLRKARVEDESATLELIGHIARSPEERERLLEENEWIRSRELVQVEESFRSIADRLRNGEVIERLTLPGLDGSSVEVILDPDGQEINSGRSGILYGTVPDAPESTVVLAFYEDADSGIINMPSRRQTISYDPAGDHRMVVRDLDLAAQAKALPCHNCLAAGTAKAHSEHSP